VDEPYGFRDFVQARSAALVRSAWLLTGSETKAQDLVQSALVKCWSKWTTIARQDAPEAYVRRVVMSIYLSGYRRRWLGELAVEAVPELPDDRDALAEADLRACVAAALETLPRRQRAVVVLRYFDDLTEQQTADTLGCSVGTVKSQNFKALARLRGCAQLGGLFDEEAVR
jgi:RNA polymerase sigma-70 factor (sigma-E family)